MTVRSELEQLVRAALDDDPQIALVACRRLQRDELPWLTERAVRRARADGWAWRPIARLLQISHQAAAKRYRSVEHGPPPRRSPQPRWGELEARGCYDAIRHLRLAEELRAWERSGVEVVPW